MSAEPPQEDDATRWEGYSDYQNVSQHITRTVNRALQSYARIDAAMTEGAPIDPETAARAHADIFEAALSLVAEMEHDRMAVAKYDQILERWQGDGGYLKRFQNVQLGREMPAFVQQFVMDIRSAAWELGYLQAGRNRSTTDTDTPDQQAEAMFC